MIFLWSKSRVPCGVAENCCQWCYAVSSVEKGISGYPPESFILKSPSRDDGSCPVFGVGLHWFHPWKSLPHAKWLRGERKPESSTTSREGGAEMLVRGLTFDFFFNHILEFPQKCNF